MEEKNIPEASDSFAPHNPFVNALLTDLYQITMSYAYWKNRTFDSEAVFDLFFRKHPFQGEFTIFAGLEEALRYVASFRFSDDQIDQLRRQFPHWDSEYWAWLKTVDTKRLRIYAVPEGTLVIPRVPLLRVEGPLAVCQFLETTLLVLINFSSLVATNAARHRLAVGPQKLLLEFGLRRAQGPDGAMTASHYSYMGGFDATSNVKAVRIFAFFVFAFCSF